MKNWIKISEQLPPINLEIHLIWDCPTNGCMGEVNCERTEEGYLISPGNFLNYNEHPIYWMIRESWPQECIDLNNSYYGIYPYMEDSYDPDEDAGNCGCSLGMDPYTECPTCS